MSHVIIHAAAITIYFADDAMVITPLPFAFAAQYYAIWPDINIYVIN